ncbi:MFS transporter [Scopulibacillus cellulosilyticus]|uniref:MFS transporter n=1 Tax=Scopulibacillus cellulosilyticus TaxID=2665665 RepID=A0ABW2Q6H2_9BACL
MNTKRIVLVSVLCGLGYMMYSVDRMVMSSSVGLIAKELGLEKAQSGVLLSSFFYGFIAFLFIGGIFSDKFNSKSVVIIGIALFSLFTGLTGLATGFTVLIVYRILTGVGEGVFWPAASLEIAKVTTERQRTTVMSLYWAGYPIGGFFGTWLGAIIGPLYGWRAVFYVTCFLGLIIALLYGILIKPTQNNVSANIETSSEKVPIRIIFKQRSVILIALYYFVLLSGWWIVLLWAPTFLVTAKHMSLSVGGTIASLAGISGAIGGLLIGKYCDLGSLQRKMVVLISITVLSGLLMAAIVLDMPTWLITICIFLLGFFGYPITPVVLAVTSNLVPKQIAGSALGFVTNVGMAAGAISPVVLGVLSEHYQMSGIWFVAAIVMMASIVLLFFTGKVETSMIDKEKTYDPINLKN